MAIATLSNTLIEQRKVATLEAQNLRKVVPFRDINLIDGESIEYNGQKINLTPTAFKNLLGLLGMSNQFAQKFESLFTKEAKSQFINTMKNAMASNSGKLSEVTLVLNPISKSVVAITKKDQFGISNQQFMGVAENIIDNHGMNVTNWSVDPGTGIVTINAFNPKANFAVQGLSDEVFTGGVTFKNSLDQGSMEKFFENMNDLRKNNFAPTGFADRVRMAHNTPASLNELQFAHNLIEPFAGERSNTWIPYAENMNAFYNAGLDSISAQQMKAAKSNTSVWDVINGVTHFATHGAGIIDTNMQDYNASDLMVKSGNLFGKKAFDHENTMPDLFRGRDLVRNGSLLN